VLPGQLAPVEEPALVALTMSITETLPGSRPRNTGMVRPCWSGVPLLHLRGQPAPLQRGRTRLRYAGSSFLRQVRGAPGRLAAASLLKRRARREMPCSIISAGMLAKHSRMQ